MWKKPSKTSVWNLFGASYAGVSFLSKHGAALPEIMEKTCCCGTEIFQQKRIFRIKANFERVLLWLLKKRVNLPITAPR